MLRSEVQSIIQCRANITANRDLWPDRLFRLGYLSFSNTVCTSLSLHNPNRILCSPLHYHQSSLNGPEQCTTICISIGFDKLLYSAAKYLKCFNWQHSNFRPFQYLFTNTRASCIKSPLDYYYIAISTC